MEYSLNRETSLTNHLRSTTGRKKTDILLNQTLGQVKQSSLVIDGNDSYPKHQQDQLSSINPQTTPKVSQGRISAKSAYRTSVET